MIIEAVELPETNLKITVDFGTREEANEFAKRWTRKTLMGCSIGKTSVSVYNVTAETQEWIESYISTKNELNASSDKDLLGLLGL